MKILIIGATGYVAQHLIDSLVVDGVGSSLISACRTLPGKLAFTEVGKYVRVDFSQSRSDVAEQLTAVFAAERPSIIVNCAAQSSLGVCEKDPTAAFCANCPLGLLDAL